MIRSSDSYKFNSFLLIVSISMHLLPSCTVYWCQCTTCDTVYSSIVCTVIAYVWLFVWSLSSDSDWLLGGGNYMAYNVPVTLLAQMHYMWDIISFIYFVWLYSTLWHDIIDKVWMLGYLCMIILSTCPCVCSGRSTEAIWPWVKGWCRSRWSELDTTRRWCLPQHYSYRQDH